MMCHRGPREGTGPLLVPIYTNDIAYHVCSDTRLILCADDCTYLLATYNPSESISTINANLECLARLWKKKNCRLLLNRSKTKGVDFSLWSRA